MIFPTPQRNFAAAFVTSAAAKVTVGRGEALPPHILSFK